MSEIYFELANISKNRSSNFRGYIEHTVLHMLSPVSRKHEQMRCIHVYNSSKDSWSNATFRLMRLIPMLTIPASVNRDSCLGPVF